MTTTSGPEDFGALHERVLRFMGAFSSVQFAIDTMVSFHLKRQMTELGPEVADQLISRVRDDQRLKLFTAYAAEVKYDGDLKHFKLIYNRAKQLRDMIGHSLGIHGPVYRRATVPPIVSVARVSTSRIDLVPSPLFPSTFVRFTADCEWLSAHVYRAGYADRPEMFIDATGNPTAPPIPAALPDGGEPLPA
jgi:hypothetical protein